jgi:DNA-binding response OmpR family regulator
VSLSTKAKLHGRAAIEDWTDSERLYELSRQVRYLLMSNADIQVRHTRILQNVRGPEYGTEMESLRTLIHQLRKLLDLGGDRGCSEELKM